MSEPRNRVPGIPCPSCSEAVTEVTDTRPHMNRVRRRRECPNGHRFTTYEMVAKDERELLDAVERVHSELERLERVVMAATPIFPDRSHAAVPEQAEAV